MKKLFALLLAVTMTATLSLGAFATELTDNPSNVTAAGDYTIGVNGNFVAGSAAADVISVDIAWDTMRFTYTAGGTTYNPTTHTESTSGGGWSTDKAGITLGADVTLPVIADLGLNGCTFTVENGKILVLDLNGHTVTGVLYMYNYAGDGTAQFTVKNGTLQCTSDSDLGTELGVIETYKITTQINDVTITASGLYAVATISAPMRIIDCTLNGGVLSENGINTVANAGGAIIFAGETFVDGGIVNGTGVNGNVGITNAVAGTYNFDPTDLVNTNAYTVTDNGDGTWTVAANASE